MRRFKDRTRFTDIGPRRHAQPAHQPGTQVGNDVAVKIGQHHHIVELRLLHKLHAHIVNNAILKFDVGVALGDLAADLQKQSVSEFEDVGLVDRSHFLAPCLRAYSRAYFTIRRVPVIEMALMVMPESGRIVLPLRRLISAINSAVSGLPCSNSHPK